MVENQIKNAIAPQGEDKKKFINKNLKYLSECYKNQKFDKAGKLLSGKRGVVLEGSSRSAKTWSCIDFIILLCIRYEKNCVINIIKETYNEFKTTLYNDFNQRLNDFGLENPFESKQEISSFKIFGNKINFLGADKPSKFHGAQCDYFWINEALSVSKSIFDQQEMRCKKFWMMDFNPSATEHYIFNSVMTRPDVGHCHSIFTDNPFISIPERNKILSYEPTLENIKNGTADDFMWKVYGLGERGQITGLIFKNVTWIDEFPANINYHFSMDLGFVNDPTALVKFGLDGNNLYAELLCYEPIDNAPALSDFLYSEQIKAKGLIQGRKITIDCADRYNDVEMVKELKNLGHNAVKCNKGKGVVWSIGLLKKYKIHLVRNVNVKKEQENYKWRTINGISINEPVHAYCHFFDALRYGIVAEIGQRNLIKW